MLKLGHRVGSWRSDDREGRNKGGKGHVISKLCLSIISKVCFRLVLIVTNKQRPCLYVHYLS